MNSDQLTIPGVPLPSQAHPLDDVLVKIRDKVLPEPNFTKLVEEVGSKCLGLKPGSVILCAAPSGFCSDDLVAEVRAHLVERLGEGDVRTLHAPTAYRRGKGPSTLLNSYHHPLEPASTPHRFQLDFGDSFAPRDEFYRITSLLRRADPKVYLVHNIHRLQSADQGIGAAIDALHTIAELASTARRTHVLFGDTSILLSWYANPEVARIASLSLLKPYFPEARDTAGFNNVLASYDRVLSGNMLWENRRELRAVTAGWTFRVRQWLVEGLCLAKAKGDTALNWGHMIEARLSPASRRDAHAQAVAIEKYFSFDAPKAGPSDPAVDKVDTRRRNPNPGRCKPDRNPVAA